MVPAARHVRYAAVLLALLAPSLISSPANAAATTITASVTKPSVTTGETIDVVGAVSPANATPRIVVQRLVNGSWSDRAAAAVDPATGQFRVPIRPSEHGTYDLRVRSNGGSVTSEPFQLVALPRPTTITASLRPTTVRVGTDVVVDGAVVEHDALREVVVQRRVDGRWQDRATGSVDQRSGRFAITITPSQPGIYELRVRSSGGTRFSATMYLGVSRPPVQTITYSVTTRGSPGADLDAFAKHARATLADGRGWTMGGSIEFREVARGGSFTLVLSQASQVPSFGPPCDSSFSCRSGRYVIINDTRWRTGAPGWGLSLDSYRHYVVNHEVGHWLGQGHASCPGRGAPGPVMMQQSKATAPCTNTVWPLAWERSQVAHRRGVPIW